jgi:hypothetical protein
MYPTRAQPPSSARSESGRLWDAPSLSLERRQRRIPAALASGEADDEIEPRSRARRGTLDRTLAPCSAHSSGGGSAYGSGDPALAASNPGGGPIDPFLTNGQAVQRALDPIAARAGRPMRVTSIEADRLNGLIVIKEPKKHVNVDRYVVRPMGRSPGRRP